MTRYELLKARWQDGCGAGICSGARKVFCRGALPCDVLFIGEAPGVSEDTIGQPFVGEAGKLLDKIVANALLYCMGADLRLAFANLVGCIPRDEGGGKAGPPCHQDIQHCAPRLRDIVDLARPRLIVAVGTLARDYLDRKMRGNVWETQALKRNRKKEQKDHVLHPGTYVPRIDIVHPAAILRANEAQQGLMAQRAEIQLVTAFQSLLAPAK